MVATLKNIKLPSIGEAVAYDVCVGHEKTLSFTCCSSDRQWGDHPSMSPS